MRSSMGVWAAKLSAVPSKGRAGSTALLRSGRVAACVLATGGTVCFGAGGAGASSNKLKLSSVAGGIGQRLSHCFTILIKMGSSAYQSRSSSYQKYSFCMQYLCISPVDGMAYGTLAFLPEEASERE